MQQDEQPKAKAADYSSILNEWFGEVGADGQIATRYRERWFKKDPAFDEHLREQYARLFAAGKAGELDDWARQSRGALALIILLDQFGRNMFRGRPEMFSGDDKALKTAEQALEQDFDHQVPVFMRNFFYMPFMHSEDLAAQERCVELFDRFAQQVPDSTRASYVKYAIQHRDIVKRFGRFPHRNEILARPSTDEELAFLKQPGSSF